MPKKILGPFDKLQGVERLVADPGAEHLQRLEKQINAVLAEFGCNCNGHSNGLHRDEYWHGDLSGIVKRCCPHSVQHVDKTGRTVTATVSVDIRTLRVEVDHNDEIVAWIYEES